MASNGGASDGGPLDGSTGAVLGAVPMTCPGGFAPAPTAGVSPPASGDPDAGAALAPVWAIRPPAGWMLQFGGVVDPDGNAYWHETELATGASVLGSATRDGVLRFRVPGPGALLLAGSTLVAGGSESSGCAGATPRSSDVLEGYSSADGSRRWRRELLAVLTPWLRSAPAPGTCRHAAMAAMAAHHELLVAVSILDSASTEHESGYLALDPATGDVLWTARTSPPGNVMMTGLPVFAEDGNAYGARTDDYLHDDLLVFPGGDAPLTLVTPADAWHGAPLAAYGPLLITQVIGGASWMAPPSGLEVRCRNDGAVLAQPGSLAGLPLLAGDALWMFGDTLGRWSSATGASLWMVRLGQPPDVAPGRYVHAFVARSSPIVGVNGAIAFTEQQGVYGMTSADLQLMTPVLRVVAASGVEVLRRALPDEVEGYGGPAAAHGGRFFSGGIASPSAGGGGVLRAFDVTGFAPAAQGWITTGGSMARDGRAR